MKKSRYAPGDYVALVRSPTFRGVVTEVWSLNGISQWRAQVQWENCATSAVNQELDIGPTEPFMSSGVVAATATRARSRTRRLFAAQALRPVAALRSSAWATGVNRGPFP